jgi:aminoglycoside/choline kinase family phosphotransferase
MTRLVFCSLSASTVIGWKCATAPPSRGRLVQYYTIAFFVVNWIGHLGAQAIHGDYQSTNLFFAEDQLCAIIDWDQAYVASPAWEVMRTLDLVCGED